MSEPAVAIEGLSHSYGKRLALDGVLLSVQVGEIFGFLGPNGSGKTTLFRILCTLLPCPPGKVKVFGLDLSTQREEVRRRIGVVFQSPSLDKQLTAEENLRCHGHLYGLRGKELSSRMAEMLERFDLADRRKEIVGTFSGGMRRRVELAKGLLNRPSLLLLDEPSTGLDPGARIDLWRSLRQIQKDSGVTIMLTTHLMDEGDRCNRLAILNRGKLAACEAPAAMKEKIGGDVITMTPTAGHGIGDLRKAIGEKLGVESEEVDSTLRIERAKGHQFVPQLIEALPGMVESVSVGKPTLEDVFINVTGRTFKDE